MKLAILSDIHDRLDHLALVLDHESVRTADHLCFLGDFCAPFTLAALIDGYPGPIDCVFGNNDGDYFLLCQFASNHERVTFHQPLAELELGGKKIALHHYPEIGKRLAQSGEYDAVFSGHDHQRYTEMFGETLWANPGEIMGRFGKVSFGIYDTETGEFRHESAELP